MIRIVFGVLLLFLGQGVGVAMAVITLAIMRSFPRPMSYGQYMGLGALAILTLALVSLLTFSATDLVASGLIARKRRRSRV